MLMKLRHGGENLTIFELFGMGLKKMNFPLRLGGGFPNDLKKTPPKLLTICFIIYTDHPLANPPFPPTDLPITILKSDLGLSKGMEGGGHTVHKLSKLKINQKLF